MASKKKKRAPSEPAALRPSVASNALITWRLGHGLSQTAAARRLDVGFKEYVAWEMGARQPKLLWAERLEAAVGIGMRSWNIAAKPLRSDRAA